MKTTLLIATFLLFFGKTFSQEKEIISQKYIEVTGSSELEVNPDEIILVIDIAEYWKEEFEGKSVEKFKTKITLDKIEKSLMGDLKKVGITKEQIKISGVGNYWRVFGKETLLEKEFEINLKSFEKLDTLLQTIDTKGISYIRLGELKNEKITEYRKQVKTEALKAAKTKAAYLVESLDKKLGDIVSITELNENNFTYWRNENLLSNSVITTSDNSGMENVRKIKLRYEIKVRFEIQ